MSEAVLSLQTAPHPLPSPPSRSPPLHLCNAHLRLGLRSVRQSVLRAQIRAVSFS